MADLNKLTDMKDHTSEFDPQDIENNKVMALLAYLFWLVLIPLFAAKDSKFARFHCNQGIILAIAELALNFVVFPILSGILGGVPVVGLLISIVSGLVGLCFFVLSVIGIINAVQGQAKELPVIGGFKILK